MFCYPTQMFYVPVYPSHPKRQYTENYGQNPFYWGIAYTKIQRLQVTSSHG
ncbi:hypothetical protein Hanom_Chr02g00132621 [Helianthus anomalus]